MDSPALTAGPCRMVRAPSAPFGRSGCLWVRQAHHRSLPDSQIPRLPSVARDAYGFGKLTTGPCRIVRSLGPLRSLGMPLGSASSPQVLAGWSEWSLGPLRSLGMLMGAPSAAQVSAEWSERTHGT